MTGCSGRPWARSAATGSMATTASGRVLTSTTTPPGAKTARRQLCQRTSPTWPQAIDDAGQQQAVESPAQGRAEVLQGSRRHDPRVTVGSHGRTGIGSSRHRNPVPRAPQRPARHHTRRAAPELATSRPPCGAAAPKSLENPGQERAFDRRGISAAADVVDSPGRAARKDS